MIRDGPLHALRWRILLAFVVVAGLSVAVVTALTVISTRAEVETLVGRDHARTTLAIAREVAAAYRTAGGWEGADLSAARAVADAAGAHFAIVETTAARPQPVISPRLILRAASGPVAAPRRSEAKQPSDAAGLGSRQQTAPTASASPRAADPTGPRQPAGSTGSQAPGAPVHPRASATSSTAPGRDVGPPTPTGTPAPGRTPTPSAQPAEPGVPVIVDGLPVGAVVVSYPTTIAADAAALHARDVILDRVALAAVLALLVAAAMSAYVARRIARPVTALTAAAGAVERGERRPAVPTRAPGELGRLARSFAHMAAGLAAAEQARRAVVADVAHEIRTPVTVLRGNLEGMVDGVTAPTPEALQSLHDEVLKLARVLDDLAALAAADEATLRLERAPLDLACVAGRVVDLLATTAADAGVVLTTSLASTPVLGDETRLHQVIMNLVGNAVKFTSDGGTVHVCVCRGDDAAEVSVSDSGPGIPAEDLPHVFERFWRGEQAAGTSGTGIGLAVVKQLVEAHGGTVQASSSPGHGARFVVRLPARDAGQVTAPPRGEK